MTPAIEKIRQEIARSYCKSVVVIDDDAYEQFDYPITIHPIYQPLVRRCNEDSILCHLQFYPKANGSPNDDNFKKYFKSALQAAQKSDVIILDWHLGVTDSSEHAMELLKELENKKGFKLVIIYTAFPGDVIPELKNANYKTIGSNEKTSSETIEESDDFAPTEDSDNHSDLDFVKDNKIFVTVRDKKPDEGVHSGDIVGISSEDIIEVFYSLMLHSFPSLIQWAGLETGANIIKNIPELVSRLPRGVDQELALQLFFKNMPDEISTQIRKLFIDDLSYSLNQLPAEIIKDENLKELIPENYRNHYDGSKTQLEKGIEKIKSDIENLGTEIDAHRATPLIEMNKFIESNTVIENSISEHLLPGMVLAKEEQYFLCITPLCDLYRLQKGSVISFLKGSKSDILTKTGKQKYTQVAIDSTNGTFQIKFDLSDIEQIIMDKKCNGYPILSQGKLDGYRFVGSLRDDIFQRIVQRTWTYRTRVGTDILEAVRLIRDE